jgi:uncharacterized membrane protein YoaK (UPF0700 family)
MVLKSSEQERQAPSMTMVESLNVSRISVPSQSAFRMTRLAVAEDPLWVGAWLAATGGFLDAFTYLAHGRVFANAMTGNVVLLAVFATTGDWRQSLRHIPPILAFLLGVAVAQLFRRLWLGNASLRGPAVVSLAAEMVFLCVAGWFPKDFPDLPLVLGISFLAALQSSTFLRIEKWPYNSTVTTGNLRQFGEAGFNAIFSRTDPDAVRKAKLFATLCLSFAAGAIVGGFCTPRMHNKALWVADALLFLAWLPLMAAWGLRKN